MRLPFDRQVADVRIVNGTIIETSAQGVSVQQFVVELPEDES